MKPLLSALLLLQLFLPATPAHAWGIPRLMVEVSTEKLVLMGTPMENRATGEKIALTCTEFDRVDVKSCKKLQFALFKGRSAFLFGEKFILQDPANLKGELKENYRQLKKIVKYDMGTYWGGTSGLILVIVAGLAATVTVAIAGAPTVVFGGMAAITIGGAGYLDHMRGILDIHAGIRGAFSGEQLDATRTTEGWNWSVNTKKVSAMKFYHYKRSIDLLVDQMSGARSLLMQLTPPEKDQCRVNFARDSYQEFYPEDRMIAMSEVVIAREMARKYGCALTLSDPMAEYQFTVDSDRHHRKITLKNTITGEVLESETSRIRKSDVKDDREMMEILE